MKRKILTSFFPGMLLVLTLMAQKPTTTLDVIYFHATRRCPTCMAIEENTRKTLNAYFSDQLKKGSIKLTVINVDDSKNKAIAEKYEASGSALFLTKTEAGKEKKNDMTDFAFSYARIKPEKFISGLKDKINELMK